MELLGSPASPYTRKVRIVAGIKGLAGSVHFVTVDTAAPDGSLRRKNPLGKIPALVLDDGSALYDSRVIAEYLDSTGTGPVLFPDGAARWPALCRQALGDGICDAAILQIYEKRFRPENMRSTDWVSMQAAKVSHGLEALESAHETDLTHLTIGDVAIAAALGYLDLRFDSAWRNRHSKLAGWLDRFAERVPDFAKTAAD